jgi:ferredoxin--NADP+ reductase
VSDLLEHYDQVVYAMGCQAARPLGVEGEHLPGVHSALDVVSWYNAHPDYLDAPIRLDVSNVVIVGAGDVSMDLSRLLALPLAELATTDMPPYALAEFAKKRVQHIHVLIRRGPESANFALKELRAVLEREFIVPHCDLELVRQALLDPQLERDQRAKLEYLQARCQQEPHAQGAVHLWFRFLRSPVSFSGQERLQRVRVELNALTRNPGAEPRAVGSGEFEEFDAELAVYAVGYRGVPLPGIPLDPKSGLIPNVEGQLLREGGALDPHQYVVGWLKRGPQGVIGTNKGDARATVERMLANLGTPTRPLPPTAELLEQRGVRAVTFADWLVLDRLERERGGIVNKPREKWLSTKDAIEALSAAKV